MSYTIHVLPRKVKMDDIRSVLTSRQVQKELIYLYQQSQLECTKNGKLSMEIGSSREKDLIAILYRHIGPDVQYNVDIHVPEDVKIFGENFSIKHSSAPVGQGSIKWKWTSDTKQANRFKEQLMSSSTSEYYKNMILVYVDNYSMKITIIGILKQVVIDGVKILLEDAFISRTGNNNRGVEFSNRMIKHIIKNATFRIVFDNTFTSSCSSYCDPIQKCVKTIEQLKYNMESSLKKLKVE